MENNLFCKQIKDMKNKEKKEEHKNPEIISENISITTFSVSNVKRLVIHHERDDEEVLYLTDEDIKNLKIVLSNF